MTKSRHHRRNRVIRNLYRDGIDFKTLSSWYGLTTQMIRNVVYDTYVPSAQTPGRKNVHNYSKIKSDFLSGRSIDQIRNDHGICTIWYTTKILQKAGAL